MSSLLRTVWSCWHSARPRFVCFADEILRYWKPLAEAADVLSSVLLPFHDSAKLESLVIATHLRKLGLITVDCWESQRMTLELSDEIIGIVDDGTNCVALFCPRCWQSVPLCGDVIVSCGRGQT